MAELKLIKVEPPKSASACCGDQPGPSPKWITGTRKTAAGAIPIVSSELSRTDIMEHIKCRLSAFRDDYTVPPGLYAVGAPLGNSEVFATANYKLSFDCLRKALSGMNAWILVLDTGGINVWCAAGKGTFGTKEMIRRIDVAKLAEVVEHRRIIVPQLGAPGISGSEVRKYSGFHVAYGPVRAEDIGAYTAAGYKATREMRTVTFSLFDRLILTPMEINPVMKEYYPWYAIIMLVLFGLQPEGLIFRDAAAGGLPFLLLGLTAVFSGAFLTPALLPFIPFRAFAVKGWIMGLASISVIERTLTAAHPNDWMLTVFIYLFFPAASSYIALQFTGASTFTGMSGVKKELKISIPLYITVTVVSIILLIIHKLVQWRLI